jgi:predicted nucleic acid-binding protein
MTRPTDDRNQPARYPHLHVQARASVTLRFVAQPPKARFLRSLQSPRFRIEKPAEEDLARAADLVERYADLPLGGTDATVVALAERLGEAEIATLDHRHFTVVRPQGFAVFKLRP